MLKRIAIGCLALLLSGIAAEVRADLAIYAQDTTLKQGGYDLLNLYVTGLPADAVANYQVTLEITRNAGTSGTVAFAPNGVAPDPGNEALGEQPYNYLAASHYLFAGDSLNATAGVNGGNYPTGFPSTYFAATDMTLSGAGYAPASDNPPTASSPGTLLASLLIHAVSANPGGSFSVQLVSNGTLGNGDTFFMNAAGGLVSYGSSFGSSPGFSHSITIGAATVPEPAAIVSGLTAMALVGGALGFRRIRRARRRSA
jgi:hypothetical protein